MEAHVANYTKAALMSFLDRSIERGDVNANTGNGMKAACGKILEAIRGDEDVRTVEVEVAIKQYSNKHPGDLSPDSLRVYESRTKKAISVFVDTVNEPTKNFWGTKPSIPKKSAVKKVAATGEAGVSVVTELSAPTVSKIAALTIPYPLRLDFVAQVLIPMDMKPEEADKLANFVKALAPAKA
jgi:hypothetical protein